MGKIVPALPAKKLFMGSETFAEPRPEIHREWKLFAALGDGRKARSAKQWFALGHVGGTRGRAVDFLASLRAGGLQSEQMMQGEVHRFLGVAVLIGTQA
jgi:hypothetical protein